MKNKRFKHVLQKTVCFNHRLKKKLYFEKTYSQRVQMSKGFKKRCRHGRDGVLYQHTTDFNPQHNHTALPLHTHKFNTFISVKQCITCLFIHILYFSYFQIISGVLKLIQ